MLHALVVLSTLLSEGRDKLHDRMHDDDGATAVEYGMIVALIAAVIVVVVSTLGGKISSAFNKVNANIT